MSYPKSSNNSRSSPSSLPCLSTPARLVYWIGPPAIVLATLTMSPVTVPLLPVAALPTLIAVQRFRVQPVEKRADFEKCLWSYLTSGIIGVFTAGVVQMVLGYGLFYLFHGSETRSYMREMLNPPKDISAATRAAQAAAAWSWQNVVKRLGFTYVLAGFVEEALKCLPLAYIIKRSEANGEKLESKKAIQYAIAGGLGFGAVECFAGIFGLSSKDRTWLNFASELLGRTINANFGHCLLSTLAGLRLIKICQNKPAEQQEDGSGRLTLWKFLRAISFSAFYHGDCDFLLLSISAMNGNLFWAWPKDTKSLVAMYSVVVGLTGLLGWHVQHEWRELEAQEHKAE